MIGIHALNQCHRLRENGDIAFQDTFDNLGHRQLTAFEAATL